MALSLGRLILQTRGSKPGLCRPCQGEIESYKVYAVIKQYRKGGKGAGYFYVTMHPGCVSDYIHKSWDRHIEKDIHDSGRREGSRGKTLRQFDEIELAIRSAKLQSRRRLVHLVRREERAFKLYEHFGKIAEIDSWLTEIGDKTWEKKGHVKKEERNLFLGKIGQANQWAVEHGQERI